MGFLISKELQISVLKLFFVTYGKSVSTGHEDHLIVIKIFT